MRVYELWDNTIVEEIWTYVCSVRSRSHEVLWTCGECGRGTRYPSGELDVLLEGGTQFPDIMLCGAFPLLIISERAVSAFREAGIKSFVTYDVGIAGIEESPLELESAPRYFRIEIFGECMIDFAATGITVTGICRRCGSITRIPPTARPLQLLRGSWDGSDLFRDCRHFPLVLLCTQKVVDAVTAYGLTNFRFEALE